MDLHHYLTRLYSLVTSRQEIDIEQLFADETIPGREDAIEGRLRFWDGSLLEFVETLVVRGFVIVKTDYTYHYQDSASQLIFRYDNAPHHPEVTTFPHHKHLFDESGRREIIAAATPPHSTIYCTKSTSISIANAILCPKFERNQVAFMGFGWTFVRSGSIVGRCVLERMTIVYHESWGLSYVC